MHISRAVVAASMAGVAAAGPRFIMYYDQWHTTTLSKDVTAGITHVMTSFANPAIFTTDPPGDPTMFVDSATLRPSFDSGTKICLAIGGWGTTDGFTTGQKTQATRELFAKNVNKVLEDHDYDCVDVDWEYPGGNGEDYKRNPNLNKIDEIDNYPLLLQAIKDEIGDKELSIAVPGREVDFIAFTPEKVPAISKAVDIITVMTYDLMNRRDNETNHHSSVQGSLETVEKYLDLGMDAAKMNLGIAFYAKFFQTAETCTGPIGCETAVLEDEDGADTMRSGAKTFMDGFEARGLGRADGTEGGQWYWDPSTSYFWTWDTPDFIAQKFDKIVKAKGLGGVSAWSLGEDSSDHTYIKAIRKGLKTLSSCSKARRS
ncbi:family 18 glycoside hydrolase [Xylaria palmicola]|nr:family 18 glycoside hydrolase [Xylaria palmicola]